MLGDCHVPDVCVVSGFLGECVRGSPPPGIAGPWGNTESNLAVAGIAGPRMRKARAGKALDEHIVSGGCPF